MFVYQPLAMVYDLEQIGYALITGDLDSFTPYSDIGIAASRGVGTIDILVGMVKGIGYVPIEFVRAIESGDPERIGGATLNAALLAYGACKAVGGIRGAVRVRLGNASGGLTYPIPKRMARIIPAEYANTPRLAACNASEAWVTAADDIAGINTSEGLAQRLTLVDDSGNLILGPPAVIEFHTSKSGIATPINPFFFPDL